MSRSQKQPILYQDKLQVPEKYLRFATPEVVALYRADKLKCNKLVEIGAGIGGQTFAFAKVCKKVLAIELDRSKANILIDNLKKLRIQNVEVLVGDALSKKAVEKIKDFQPEIIFCDTEREEKGERTIESIKPSIKKLLEIFSEVTSKIAIEIPPFTDTEQLNENFEREFISVNQQLNRLTLYFNELKQSDVSVIALPSGEKIETSDFAKYKLNSASGGESFHDGRVSEKRVGARVGAGLTERNREESYLYIIDPAIIVADLISELANKLNAKVLELNKPVLVSDKKINSNFLTGYKVLTTCKNEQKEILQNLKEMNAGKIVLRYNIEPKDYWKVRNFYENQLIGRKEISLFVDEKNNEAILTEKIN
jgi:16S rRNA G966 N2-methylase RsmD